MRKKGHKITILGQAGLDIVNLKKQLRTCDNYDEIHFQMGFEDAGENRDFKVIAKEAYIVFRGMQSIYNEKVYCDIFDEFGAPIRFDYRYVPEIYSHSFLGQAYIGAMLQKNAIDNTVRWDSEIPTFDEFMENADKVIKRYNKHGFNINLNIA